MSGDLLPADIRRWVARRKAAVVTAVHAGHLTFEEALRRYQLTEEECRSWERSFEVYGLPGVACYADQAIPGSAGGEQACITFPASADYKIKLRINHGEVERVFAGKALSDTESGELLAQWRVISKTIGSRSMASIYCLLISR